LKEGPDMVPLPQALDDRFEMEDIVAASDLQGKAMAQIRQRLKQHHKLLITHYSSKVGVLVDVDDYRALVGYVAHLAQTVEDLMEEREAAHARALIDARDATGVPEDAWLSESQIWTSFRKLLDERFGSGDGR